MKIIKKLGLLFILLVAIVVYIGISYSIGPNTELKTVIYKANADKICEDVKNSKIKVYVYDYYKKRSNLMVTDNNSCQNSNYFSQNMSNLVSGDDYESWTNIGRMSSSYNLYIDGEAKKTQKIDPDFSCFYIRNVARAYDSSGKLNNKKTLKPGDKIYFEINLDTDKFTSSEYNDVRISFNYGVNSSINIEKYDSIAYYLFDTNGNEYGPYKFEYSDYVNLYYLSNKDRVNVYKIVSENLLTNINGNVTISKIKIVPYEYHTFQKGNFLLYNLSIEGYQDDYASNKNYITLDDGNNIIRHNIINNRIVEGTVKWDASTSDKTMHVYYKDSREPIEFGKNTKDNVYYGMPYVTAKVFGSSIYSFTNQMTKDDGIYHYNIATNYLGKENAYNGKTDTTSVFESGSKIETDDIYILNDDKTESLQDKFNDTKKYHPEIKDLDVDFINNNHGYLYGHSCTTSIYAPVSREIPVLGNIWSYEYFYDNQTRMLGNLSLTLDELEKYLRENNILTQNQLFAFAKYKSNYTKALIYKYSTEEIYNAYALTIPGDVVSHPGHARLVSGYAHVECYDKIHQTDRYVDNYCRDYGGINPDKSYVITIEGGTAFVRFKDRSTLYRYVEEAKTGWDYQIDPNYTDLVSLDSLVTAENVFTTFRPNYRYYFTELYNNTTIDVDTGDDEDSVDDENLVDYENISNDINSDVIPKANSYLPFRFKQLDLIENTNQIELPKVRFILDQDGDVNTIMKNYIKNNKKLKGTLYSNYLIDVIKIEINDEKFYVYPNLKQIFSLFYDLDSHNAEVNKYLANLDFSKDFKVKISVKSGPQLESVLASLSTDNEGYITVLDFTNNKYKVISPNLNFNLFKGEFQSAGVSSIEVLDNDNQLLQDNLIYTGSKTKMHYYNGYIDEFVNVVLGDVSGDGKISSRDYVKIRNHIMNETKIVGDFYLMAADMNNDSLISALDYVKIKNYIMRN